jgi:DNA adenine methylase
MIEIELDSKLKVKPFLRWTGSKSWFVRDHLQDYLPDDYNNYHECFLGGGSVFFALRPDNKSYLYDTNKDLINAYEQIRDNVDLVISALGRLKNTEEEYYRIRNMRSQTPHTSAAKFIYLNRCSFNGIYRVNSKGEYNVPYGRRNNVDIVTKTNLKRVSQQLKKVKLIAEDFSTVMNNIQPRDLVFFDPPYTVAHENNGFIAYNQKLFSLEDQKKLSSLLNKIDELGAYYILTNAAHEAIDNIYENTGRIDKVFRYSRVGGRNKTRGMFKECIITNIKK